MAITRQRLRRVEQQLRQEAEARREDHYRMMRLIARCQLEHEPDLRLVEPCDTDPNTYNRIRQTLAWADGRHEEAERLRALEPPESQSMEEREARLGDFCKAASEWINEVTETARVEGEKTERAIARVRKRLGATRRRGRPTPPRNPGS